MHTAMFCLKHQRLIVISLLLVMIGQGAHPQNIPLANAFAHNDYWHKHPLYDALDNGFTQVEADIYLRHGKLIVAHILPVLTRKRNLEGTYLKPLQDFFNGNNKMISTVPYPMLLMIDIKSGAEKTYAQLQVLLEKYRPMLSGYENGKFTQRQVTVVITGHKPYDTLKAQQSRLAFIDEDLMQVKQDTLTANVYQTASCKYSRLLKWTGKGNIPFNERQRLCGYVMLAHKFGKRVRLWASPENPVVWKELLDCGVDLINTDQLAELKKFLLTEHQNYAKAD
ncbi:phosphatidylinositol-specific phospholipase C/glycerophosphodiester phosphodiesterase family protein [Mucilaginibacter paludis]|uniref:Altered inheritance of mitochondria protein 6 n=1 Tax=Mucilaginibacter paludis DSM 18603 TaxID=714943 RepID=H1Y4I1_9SPHI|nr:phosphatidylinositol-specific phospholipase C/glycerophosphodiester phosphodiesterase family protein [Mucilaginibacter paludis]EHQ26765.1 hypothetical protein Mucpa_2651 [Mucilaginibacter paludis DSM 18603]